MDDMLRRSLGRRDLLRRSLVGAGAATLALSGPGRRFASTFAQEATPTAQFDAAACYQQFPGATMVQYDAVGSGPFSIALSNSYIGNVWRTQMIKMSLAYSKLPEIAPMISEYNIASSGEDPSAQIAQMENMASSGAQAIIVNAISPTALSPTVQRLRADGIVVVAYDNVVEAPDIVFVNEDQVLMGQKWAEWLVEQIGGTGKVLMVNGVAGTSVDTDRINGGKSVFSQHPEIQVIEVVGKWDPGTAQTVTATALSTNPDIAGVWCQGGTDGVVRAFIDAQVPLVPVAGEAENGFRKQMLELKDQFQGYSIGQSPGLVCIAMHVALDLLQGKEVPSAIAVPLPEAKTADLVPGVNVFPDLPDNFFTPIDIPACGVDLSIEQIESEQV